MRQPPPSRPMPAPTEPMRRGVRRLGARVREEMERSLEALLAEADRLAASPDAGARAAAAGIAGAAREMAARLSHFEEAALGILSEEMAEDEGEPEQDEGAPKLEGHGPDQLTRVLAGELTQLARQADAPFTAGEADALRPRIRRAARLANLWLSPSLQVAAAPDAPAAAGTTSTHGPRVGSTTHARPGGVTAPAAPTHEDARAAALVALTDRVKRLEHAREDSQERAAARERYWREAIHELRNAAHAFMSWGFVLRRSELKDTPWFAPLVRSAEAVLRRAEEALDPKQAEGASFGIRTERIDLVAAAREALESIRPAADARNIKLAAATPAGGTVVAAADADRVQQILQNLLRNAVDATPPGGSVCITVAGDDGPRIEVEDTGPGVAGDVFHLQPTGRTAHGFGIGLGLSRRLAERMGGSLTVASAEPGAGARFVLRLPPATP